MRPTGIVPADASNQPKPISPGKSTDRATLAAIARQAMIVRGLEPDFPLAAQQELAAIVGPAKATENVRDLRDRLWASIDNDNFRDLDQLTVAEPLADGQVRILVAVADAPLPYTILELTELAKHCTDQEDAATKVERRVAKSAAALLLSGKIGQQFDAIVTGAADKGTWVRLLQPPTEGRLTLGFQGLKVGDHVRVKLINTDVQRGFIDFARL
jgi:exoribonuclease R